jgi:hypothetical protein
MDGTGGAWPRRIAWILGVLGLFGLLAYAGAHALMWYGEEQVRTSRTSYEAPRRPEQSGPSFAEIARGVPIDVTTSALAKAYESNELAADLRYKFQAVRIDGIVDRVHSRTWDTGNNDHSSTFGRHVEPVTPWSACSRITLHLARPLRS